MTLAGKHEPHAAKQAWNIPRFWISKLPIIYFDYPAWLLKVMTVRELCIIRFKYYYYFKGFNKSAVALYASSATILNLFE